MWERVRRCAPRVSVAYLCLSALAVGVVWLIDREGPPSAALPSQPSGGGIVSVREDGELVPSDRAAARLPVDELARRVSGGDGLARPESADDHHSRRLPPAVSADRHPRRPHRGSGRTSAPDGDRPARPGGPTRRPIVWPDPPTSAEPSTTTTETATATTSPSTGTTTPTTTPTTATTGPAPSLERRSRR